MSGLSSSEVDGYYPKKRENKVMEEFAQRDVGCQSGYVQFKVLCP